MPPMKNIARKYIAVTPSDSTPLTSECDAIFVGGAGDISLVGGDGTSAVFTVAAGSILPVGAIKVNLTGTTATNIVALYGYE